MREFEQGRLFGDEPVKRCTGCGEVKPLDQFHRNRWTRDGLQGRCKPCNIAGALLFYLENPEHCRVRIAAWQRRVNQRNKQRVYDYLCCHPCVDCGEPDPVVLEFDHRSDKSAGIAELLHAHVRWRVIEIEIAKCEVRCANCHRRRTAFEGRWFRVNATETPEAGETPG